MSMALRFARPAARALPRYSNIAAINFARAYAGKSWPAHTVIQMPALSPTMEQGGLAVWSKKIGDRLEPGEVIAEVETDKAQMDFEFQEEGYLAKVLVEDGTKDLPVGTPIGVYVENADDVAAFADFTAADAGAAPAAAPAAKEEAAPAPAAAATPAPAATKAAVATKSSAPAGRIFASPLAKTIALEKGISLKNITGTGPRGRITAKDVESYVPAAAPAPAATKAAAPAVPSAGVYEDIPISSMRKTIAKRLTSSVQTSPSYIVSSNMSVSKLLKLRASLNGASNGEYKLSINDILIKAIAKAAQKVPQVNSYWLEDQGVIRQFANVDVSVAVATPTGLITPVVKEAHSKGLATISKEIKDLGKRAKIGKLTPEEYQGGTITISNLGMNPAVNMFTSIINPPQSAIIAISTLDKKVVLDNSSEKGFAFEDTLTITGTFDHRVIDGAVGGEFIKALKETIENPLSLLL
ncbi:dihydrolipoyllysine-residue acetyltransferase [Saccharomycopsis crataegensis]|uniref:Acetyltransferase component of pyruvate dehydrogenase complex n=1 Tax=Saccharomycopsis crataegensis TaxID=43959 RepID=A0AAV5QNF0_9ASCO|nr:dihydrolipoyllysine-residue acetyltransferase [Saccharomycopsis crataegensis]